MHRALALHIPPLHIALLYGRLPALLFVLPLLLFALGAQAEILAMLNYESKAAEKNRREGLAVLDVDPKSERFGQILMDIPLPPDTVAHHIFYNPEHSKAYITALGKNPLSVLDLTRFPYRRKIIPVPDCQVGEDLVFSADAKQWFLTCMGSSNVIRGDAKTDKPLQTIASKKGDSAFIRYPHGIALHDGTDRLMVTSTVRPSDLGDAGETVTVIEAKSGKVLSTHKISGKPSPSGAAPVEVVFRPGHEPPFAYITTMFGAGLWSASWDGTKKTFTFAEAHDFSADKQGVPLEIYYGKSGDRLYVTTAANPGYFNIFDIGKDPKQPKLLKAIPTAAGAHHVAFSPDGQYAFVQNSLLNLPDMSDGEISVIDLKSEMKIHSIDTLKRQGLNANCIVLLPEWDGGGD